MKTVTFEHRGVTYTLCPPTIFDNEMKHPILIDVARAWAKSHGFDDLGQIPSVIDRLLKKYVEWLQITKITGEVPFSNVDFYGVMTVNLQGFEAWLAAILADNQALAKKWAAAYDEVMTPDTDPKNVNGGNPAALTSETLPSVATD